MLSTAVALIFQNQSEARAYESACDEKLIVRPLKLANVFEPVQKSIL